MYGKSHTFFVSKVLRFIYFCFYFTVCYTYILTTRKGVNDDRLVYNACNSYIVGMFVL